MIKTIKTVISIMLSLAIVVSVVPNWAKAAETSSKEDEISLASYDINVPYETGDPYGKLSAMFISSDAFVVKYKDLTNTTRYIEIYLSTSNKTFPKKTFVVKANKSNTVTYPIERTGVGQIHMVLHRHISSNPNSRQINPLEGRMQ